MEISVDISMYPLQKEFEAPILAFIAMLEKEVRVEVVRNEFITALTKYINV